MLRIAAFICLLFASLSYAQIGAPPGLVGCTSAYVGPGDMQTFLVWSEVRAYSRSTCGIPWAYVCDSTGGVDVACADMVTSTTTGKIVPKTIGGLVCGTDNTGLCTVRIQYSIPINSTCPIRGNNGSPGTCGAVQNTIANRYGLIGSTSCNTLPPCMFSAAAGAGYTLANSITLAQPFSMYVVAYTINASVTNTFLSIGTANIHFSTGSVGNVLNTCDSAAATATNTYITRAPSYAGDIIATCIGGVAASYQTGTFPPNTASGGVTTQSGAPTVMVSGGSPVNFWGFGIFVPFPTVTSTTNNLTVHGNACQFYGYTCDYSGIGDVASFKAAYSLRAYTAATAGNKLINACSPSDGVCQDLVSDKINGRLLLPTLGSNGAGIGNIACSAPVSSGTYNGTTGATSFAVDMSNPINPLDIASGNILAVTGLTGTASALNGVWVATTGTSTGTPPTGTVNFTGPTGLSGVSLSGATVSGCTIKIPYDISGANGCGGMPCDAPQTTIANRAVLAANCILNFYPCAMFAGTQSQCYVSTNSLSSLATFSTTAVAKRIATTTQNTVFYTDTNQTYTPAFNVTANQIGLYAGTAINAAGTDGVLHAIQSVVNDPSSLIVIDGVITTGTAGTRAAAGPINIGGDNSGGLGQCSANFLTGGIAETGVAGGAFTSFVYAALDQQQHSYYGSGPATPPAVSSCSAVPQSGLTHCWSLGDANTNFAGNTASDYVGSLTGTMSSVTRNAAGHKAGIQSGTFNGATPSSVSFASTPFAATFTSPHSVCAWVNITSNSSAGAGGGSQRTVLFSFDANNKVAIINDEGVPGGIDVAFISAGTDIAQEYMSTGFVSGTFTNVCYTWNGTTILLYVNGSLVVTVLDPGNSVATSNLLGLAGGTFGAFTGSMDTILVYNRALSAGDVTNIFNN